MEELSRAAGVLAPLAPAVTDPGDPASDAREAEAEAAGLGAEAEACSPVRCRGDDGLLRQLCFAPAFLKTGVSCWRGGV